MPDFLQRITSDAIEGNAVGIGQLSVPMDGSPGQVLATNGNGVLMWVDQTAGSGSGSGSMNETCDDAVLLIHSDTTDGSTTFTDASSTPHTVTAVGNAQHSTTEKKFGTTSIKFDGNGDELQIPHTNELAAPSGDFTMEFWFNPTTRHQAGLMSVGNTTTNGELSWCFLMLSPGYISFYIHLGAYVAVLSPDDSITAGAWNHVAAVRSGDTFTCYMNGVGGTPVTNSNAFSNQNTPLRIGNESNGIEDYTGYIDEIRISNVARYTANFTPQTTAFCQDVSSTSFTFQGTNSGYTIGGHKEFSASAGSNRLDKFSFTSSSTAISVNGDLSSPRYASGSHKSITHGYVSGGSNILSPGVDTQLTQIDKWPYASESVAVATHGTLQNPRATHCGGSSETYGYVVAGHTGNNSIGSEVMEKFTTASDSDSVVISGVLSATKFHVSASQSSTHGYVNADGATSNIQKYSFANDDNSIVYNGNLLSNRSYTAGQSSEINGYVSGGTTNGSTTVTNIERYSFASESNANNVGVLSVGRYGPVGTSTSTDGYSSGGLTGNGSTFSNVTVIDKFSFASNNNAIDHADLSQARHQPSSIQF